MKKLLGLIVAIALAFFLVTPFVLGVQAEKKIQALISHLNAYPSYKAEIDTFEKGWFSSQVNLRVGLALPEDIFADADMDVNSMMLTGVIDLHHGPLLLNEGLQLGWYHWHLTLNHTEAEGIFEQHGQVVLNGQTRFYDQLPAFGYPLAEENLQLQVSDYRGEGEINRQGLLRYRGSLPWLTLESDNDNARVDDIRVEVDGNLARLDPELLLYPGEFVLRLGRIEANLEDDTAINTFRLQDLEVETAVTIPPEATQLSINVQTRLQSLEADEWFLRNLQSELAFDNISMDFYRAYHRAHAALYESMNINDQNTFSTWDYGQFITPEVLRSLVEKGPSVRLENLSAQLPQGEFAGQVGIHIKADTPPPTQLNDFFWMIGAIQAQMQLQADHSLADYYAQRWAEPGIRRAASINVDLTEAEVQQQIAEQAQTFLASLSEEGWIVSAGNTWRSQLAYNSGEFTVNGQPMPLGSLLGSFF